MIIGLKCRDVHLKMFTALVLNNEFPVLSLSSLTAREPTASLRDRQFKGKGKTKAATLKGDAIQLGDDSDDQH